MQELIEIAKGKRTDLSTGEDDRTQEITTRVDVKNYSGAIDKATMEKFGNDIIKHPSAKGQMLAGGERLTAGAKRVLEDLQQSYGNDKNIIYLNNTEVERLHMAAKALDKNNDESEE
ncbi:Uncharacterised protein [Actinobacillus equuli]|nr:Uncharacterised protein [Actinobacillus equuli]